MQELLDKVKRKPILKRILLVIIALVVLVGWIDVLENETSSEFAKWVMTLSVSLNCGYITFWLADGWLYNKR